MKLFKVILPLLLIVSSLGAKDKDLGKQTGWNLIWQEEFNIDGYPNPDIWSFETHGNTWGWGNGEDQYYTDLESGNAIVEDGVLKIIARKERVGDKEYTSARVNSKKTGGWKYGRFEIRAKLPKGLGSWPAIWMLPMENTFGDWPNSGEIDIHESWGFLPNEVHSAIHTEKRNHKIGTSRGGKLKKDTSIYNDFNIYALEWYGDKLVFFFNEEVIFTYKKDIDKPAYWPFDYPFYIVLNSAIGGDWAKENGGVDDSIFPTTFEIDWVRVYEGVYETSGDISLRTHGDGSVVTIDRGDFLELEAIPEEGMEFSYWLGDVSGSNNPIDVFKGRNKNITAVFNRKGEVLVNGNFNDNSSGWLYWADSSVKSSIEIKDGVFEGVVTKRGSEMWQAQFNQPIELLPGDYVLEFEAISKGITKIEVALLQNYSPYRYFWGTSTLLSEDNRLYTYTFKIDESDKNARLEFQFGREEGEFTLDNISLRRVK